MSIVLQKTAHKQLLRLPRHLHDFFYQKIAQLVNPPPNFNIKKLTNKQEYRLRLGDYRIIYTIDKKQIAIRSIAHRKEAYR